MGANAKIMTKEAGMQSIKKDISLTMPSGASQQFLVDTINKAGTLPKLKPIYKDDAAGNIDTLTVSSRRIREHSKNHEPKGVNSIGEGKIPYAVKKVFWDEWLQDDDVWYNMQVREENIEATVINLIQAQFAVDLQDLIFNGDTAISATDPDKDFLSIIDGFVKRMKKSPYKTDLLDKEPQLIDFINHVQLLPEKYKNKFDDITWFITRNTHDKLMGQVSQRLTGFGDAVLQDGKLTRLSGYPIEIVSSMQSKFATLTPMQNLKPVFTRQLRYNRTGAGATAAAKDATYHIIFAYLDAVLRDINAVAWMTGNKL